MTRLLTALTLMGALTLPAGAFELDAMSDAERQIFREEIRQYLLENPEVLMEAIAVLEEREAAAQASADAGLLAANASAIYDDPHSWIGGNPDGDITLVEFIDYRCGFCRRAHPEVTELLTTDGNIRLIVKEFPILGEQSLLASRFAIAVRILAGDDAYKAAHDALIALRANVTEASLETLATSLGHDSAAVFAAMESPEVTQEIQSNRALAQTLGISGTPTFILGDQLLRGYLPLNEMRALVEEVREG